MIDYKVVKHDKFNVIYIYFKQLDDFGNIHYKQALAVDKTIQETLYDFLLQVIDMERELERQSTAFKIK